MSPIWKFPRDFDQNSIRPHDIPRCPEVLNPHSARAGRGGREGKSDIIRATGTEKNEIKRNKCTTQEGEKESVRSEVQLNLIEGRMF